MLDLQACKDQFVLGPTTAASASRSASFDFIGADYAVIRILQSSTAATTGPGFSVLHADSVPTQATQFATLTADLTGQSTTSHETVYFIDTRTAKRYGKVIITPGDTNTIITAVHLQTGRLEQEPSNTSAMVSTTNDVVRVVTDPGN